MWKWILSIAALAVLVRSGVASRAWHALTAAVRNGRLHAVWFFTVALVLFSAVPVFAGEVASSGTNDRARCNFGGYNAGGKVVTRGFCYFSVTALSGENSTIAEWRSRAGTDWSPTPGTAAAHNVAYNATSSPVGLGNMTGTWEIGPQTTSSGVSLPAGAAQWVATTSTTNWGSWSTTSGYTSNYLGGARLMDTGVGWYHTGNWYGLDESAASIDARRLDGLDWFPGGSDGLTTAFCGATVEWDGDYSQRIFEGDVLTFSWERTPLLTGNIDVRWTPDLGWAGGGSAWVTIVSESVIGSSGTGSVVVGDQGWAEGQYLGALDMRCRDIVADGFVYKNAEDDSNTINDGSLRPCASTRVTWPTLTTIFAGDIESWYLSHAIIGYGGDPDVLVEYATWDTENQDGPGPMGDLTWSTMVELSPGEFGDYDLTAVYDGSNRQFVLRCTDDQGVYYAAPWSTSARLNDPNAGAPTEEGCYGQTGLGLRPSSWVPGLMRMGSCTLRVLFVPDSEVVSDSWDGLVEDVSENAPVAWAYSAYVLVSDSADGTQAAVAAAATDCVDVIPAGGDLVESAAASVCPAAIDIGAMEAARPWMGYMVWVGWAWSMYSAMFRKAPASTEPEQLSLF